jgi:hypothetical protein
VNRREASQAEAVVVLEVRVSHEVGRSGLPSKVTMEVQTSSVAGQQVALVLAASPAVDGVV